MNRSPAMAEADLPTATGLRAVRAGFITNISNPKVVAYYASLFGVMIPHDAPAGVFVGAALTAIVVSAVWWVAVTLVLRASRDQARLRACAAVDGRADGRNPDCPGGPVGDQPLAVRTRATPLRSWRRGFPAADLMPKVATAQGRLQFHRQQERVGSWERGRGARRRASSHLTERVLHVISRVGDRRLAGRPRGAAQVAMTARCPGDRRGRRPT